MSCNALSCGGGGAQTIPLVKQRLQNSQNVWNPDASRIFRLPKQIRSSPRAHMWKTGVLQQLLRCQTLETRFHPPPTPPVCFPPVLTRRTFRSLLHHFLLCSTLRAHRPRRQVPDLPDFPDFPSLHVQPGGPTWIRNAATADLCKSHAMFC